MLEYAGKSTEEIISEFIVHTCQLLSKSHGDCMITHLWKGPTKVYSKLCGSSAEFRIRPVQSLIDDSDYLKCSFNELAFTDDIPVLPNDMSRLSDAIKCVKLEPYPNYPGFVRLRFIGEVHYDWTSKTYVYISTTFQNTYFKFNLHDFYDSTKFSHSIRGPSVSRQMYPTLSSGLKIDQVHGVWCPQWPKEAQEWLKRSRNYGWPTTDTISEIVQQGCHAVYVQHRFCRDDEQQWRLSFSNAEVILLRSWTKVQQIVYHLIRFFAKRELIQKGCLKEDEVLCTYHLKTVMLWTCEENPQEWWNSSSVIEICSELLKKLSVCLKSRRFLNYFIPEANLFRQPSRSAVKEKIESRLNEFSSPGILCLWFLENYINAFTDIFHKATKTISHVIDCMRALNDFRKDKTGFSLNILFEYEITSYNIAPLDFFKGIEPGSCLDLMHASRHFLLLECRTLAILPMPEDVSFFRQFDITLFSLHARNGLGCGKMSWNDKLVVDCIKEIFLKPKLVRCRYHNFPEPSITAGSQFQFQLAQEFMKNLTGLSSPTEFQIVSLFAKMSLRMALTCTDSQLSDLSPAALVYLAALSYASSECQIAIDLCWAVLMYETRHAENESLNAGCLLFIDDVARVVGFYLICLKFSGDIPFHKRQISIDLRLTPKVFAYYLTAQCTKRMFRQFDSNRYLLTSIFSFDQFFLALTKRSFRTLMKSNIYLRASRQPVYQRISDQLIASVTLMINPVKVTEQLCANLTEYAFENMTLFYGEIRKHFVSQGNAVDCYRAVYLYKCRKYNEVLNLCERILQTHIIVNDSKELVFANVLVFPPFDSLFDRDVRSLLGFNTLFCYLSPLISDVRENFLSYYVFSLPVGLSESRGFYCSTRCHYFAGRHFWAAYLKVRCYADLKLNYPFSRAMVEFARMRACLPFEHIVRRFLLRKFGQFRNNPRLLSHK